MNSSKVQSDACLKVTIRTRSPLNGGNVIMLDHSNTVNWNVYERRQLLTLKVSSYP